MIDVSSKINTLRIAHARSFLKVSPETVVLINQGKIPKGDPIEVAKVAAILAAKETNRIIPYCHPMPGLLNM